jgi:RNA polymerase primary sigma factor
MASEINVKPQNGEISEKEGPESPPLDLSDAAVMGLLQSAEKRGYVTNDQIDALFSSPEAKSEQIEDPGEVQRNGRPCGGDRPRA